MHRSDEEDDDLTDNEEVDLEAIHAKFSCLATALQETNQNLQTFELLQDHYKNLSKVAPAPATSVQPAASKGQDVDIVDLLKDICGSVNELKTEMGTSGKVDKLNLEDLESKLKYPQKFAELSDKAAKMEVECGFYKNQCQSLEEKYLEEKRRNCHLDSLLREREEEIRKLNNYLKESELFSKNLEQENQFLEKQLIEMKLKIEEEREINDKLKSKLDSCIATLKISEDKEQEALRDIELPKKLPAEKGDDSDLEMDLEAHPQSARSTLSSKSADGGYEEKYKELRESKNRLKQKTKLLLRQYRGKRSQLERKDRQLAAQRSGLLKLQTLHQSVEANHCIVIHHLGQQIHQTANLVSTLWPGDDLSCLDGSESGDKLSEWIIRIDALSAWTISKLVKVSMGKRWEWWKLS